MSVSTSVRIVLPALLLASCVSSGSGDDTLVIQGSDTEVQLVSSLAEAFGARMPEASVSVAGGGSAVGIASLINGETDIANSSRAMKEEEIASAKTNGFDPREFILARDGLTVIVHPSNTLASLSVDQISDIYAGRVANWSEVGGPDAPIVLYGRQSTSGTFGFFRDAVVKDDYAQTMRQMEGSQAIVDAVVSDASGIGYVGVGYAKGEDGEGRTDVKILTVSQDGSAPVSPLDVAAVEAGRYPIARPIYQYLPSLPSKGSLVEEFLRFEASDSGQSIVEQAGFYRPNAADRAANDAFFSLIR